MSCSSTEEPVGARGRRAPTAIRDRPTAGRHALNVEIEVRALVPDLQRADRSSGETLSYKQEGAGSNPALRTSRRRIAQRESTCLIRRRLLVRLQLRLCKRWRRQSRRHLQVGVVKRRLLTCDRSSVGGALV